MKCEVGFTRSPLMSMKCEVGFTRSPLVSMKCEVGFTRSLTDRMIRETEDRRPRQKTKTGDEKGGRP